MPEKIRVNVDKVELEVNDNGDIIILPVSDERFLQKLYNFSSRISHKSEEISYIDKENISLLINSDIELHESIRSEFDELFGADAYKKVFGDDIVVGAEYVIEFIDQCMPYIQKHIENRDKRFSKYSANRVGSSL